MVDARRLAEMKPRAVLVNTARGGIVDEDALYQALKEGQIVNKMQELYDRDHKKEMTNEEVLNLLAVKAFDPFPFILLNLVLSCVAAIQAPLIMMSQNRQEEKDRQRAENDYKVNLKTEIMIEDLYTLTVVCFLVVRKMICPSTMTL